MKKIVIWILTVTMFVLLCMPVPVAAEIVMNVEYFENGTETVLPETDPPGLIEVNGVMYIDTGNMGAPTIQYNGNENLYNTYQTIKNNMGANKYIWTGQYYMVWYAGIINTPSSYWGQLYKGPPLQFYDSAFNLVKEVQFDGVIRNAAFIDGKYYCYVAHSNGAVTKVSNDMENWETVAEPITEQIGNVIYREVNAAAGIYTASLNGLDFYDVSFEDKQQKWLNTQFGNWRIMSGLPEAIYITNDRIYNIKLFLDKNLETYDVYKYEQDGHIFTQGIQQIYENGDNLVIDLQNFRLTTPKQPVYDALDAIKDAPYVRVGNEILGFETPPVTESDRTLVPMRFLFEQLGAEVTWDEATETATAKKANTTINFSIDNTTATVNGAETVMDVPARLVGDKTMVPLRFLSEEMGYTVEWDEETRMATITTPLTSRVTKTEEVTFDSWIK